MNIQNNLGDDKFNEILQIKIISRSLINTLAYYIPDCFYTHIFFTEPKSCSTYNFVTHLFSHNVTSCVHPYSEQ